MKLEKYLKPVIVLLIAVIIGLGVVLSSNLQKKHDAIERANQTFIACLSLAANHLSLDYTKMDNQEKLYRYTELTNNIYAAALVYSQTEYVRKNHRFSSTLVYLNLYLTEQYALSELDLIGERQAKLYNYLLDISSNPKNTKLMNELDEYIDTFDKPIRPDSPSHKMP